MAQTYIIVYDNAHWCGGELYCLVNAEDEDEAVALASDFMEECQQELFADHYEDEPLEEGDISYTVNRVELLELSDYTKYVVDPSQASFYPKVNF